MWKLRQTRGPVFELFFDHITDYRFAHAVSSSGRNQSFVSVGSLKMASSFALKCCVFERSYKASWYGSSLDKLSA